MPFVRDILPDAERPAVRPLGHQDPEDRPVADRRGPVPVRLRARAHGPVQPLR